MGSFLAAFCHPCFSYYALLYSNFRTNCAQVLKSWTKLEKPCLVFLTLQPQSYTCAPGSLMCLPGTWTWTERARLSQRPGVTTLAWLREVRSLSVLLLRLKTAFPVQGARSERQTKVFYTSTQGTLSRLFRQRALCLCHWSVAMKWEPLSLPLDLKQCRCSSRLSGLRCANLSFFSLQSCTFWCLSGQPLSLQIYCRSKKSY